MPYGQRVERERGVRNRNVLEERLALLERPPDRRHGRAVRFRIAGRECAEGRRHVCREVVAEGRGERSGLRVPREDEQCERRRVAADRRLGLRRARSERPLRSK